MEIKTEVCFRQEPGYSTRAYFEVSGWTNDSKRIVGIGSTIDLAQEDFKRNLDAYVDGLTRI